jgi:hypothetical protein
VAVAVAENDEVIPVQLGLKLYAALTNEKRLWTFKDAGHNSWTDRAGTAWWREVMGFLERAVLVILSRLPLISAVPQKADSPFFLRLTGGTAVHFQGADGPADEPWQAFM